MSLDVRMSHRCQTYLPKKVFRKSEARMRFDFFFTIHAFISKMNESDGSIYGRSNSQAHVSARGKLSQISCQQHLLPTNICCVGLEIGSPSTTPAATKIISGFCL